MLMACMMSLGGVRASDNEECGDETNGFAGRSRVSITSFNRINKTDETGEYDIIVNKYSNGKKLNPGDCFLRLGSSPETLPLILVVAKWELGWTDRLPIYDRSFISSIEKFSSIVLC